jgi:hypothetical protein
LCFAWTGLRLDPPTSASCIAGIIGGSHYTWPSLVSCM